jgi:hypothetical protein
MPGIATLPVSGEALTTRLVDSRARAALPSGRELAGTQAASVIPAGHAAIMLTDAGGASGASVRDDSVSGAIIASGAPDASGGGAGTGSASASGSSGSGTAMITTAVGMPLHEGFALSRIEPRTAQMHTSIQPLERPG